MVEVMGEVDRYIKRVGKFCMYVNIVSKKKTFGKGREKDGGEMREYIFYYKLLL